MYKTLTIIKRRPLLWGLLGLGLIANSSAVLACSAGNLDFKAHDNRLDITGAVTCTLTDIYQNSEADWSILTLLDAEAKDWRLNAKLHLEAGARLNLYGDALGGDVNTLRMVSGVDGYVNIIADWGQVDIRHTSVMSWDTNAQAVDEELDDGRAYITVRSFLGEDGVARESRLDVINSEIAYLGYYSGEAYGLTWKVADDNFEQVNVYGDIRNSYLHHNHRGHYSWGAFGSVLDNNEIAYSVEYGVDPHDDSDEFVITNNYIHHSGSHGIICSQRCNDLVITGNTLSYNDNGIMLHREMIDSVVANNTITHSANTGIAIYDSYDNIIRDNELDNNHIGIRVLVGSRHNVIENNTISNSERYGLFVSKGSTASQTNDGISRDNVFQENIFINNAEGIFILESDENDFINNSIEGFSEIFVRSSKGNLVEGNTFTESPRFRGRGEDGAGSQTNLDDMPDLILDLDAFSSVTFSGEFNQLKSFDSQDGLTNHFGDGELTLSLDSDKTYLNGPLVDLLFWVEAQAPVTITHADLDKNTTKTWQALSPDAAQQIRFEVGHVLPDRQFKLLVDGIETAEMTSSSAGSLFINHPMTAGNQTSFTLNVVPEKEEAGGTLYWLIALLSLVCLRRIRFTKC